MTSVARAAAQLMFSQRLAQREARRGHRVAVVEMRPSSNDYKLGGFKSGL
jgi:hypothetical protein